MSNEISDFGAFFAAVTHALNEGLRKDSQTLLSGGTLSNGADLVTVLLDGYVFLPSQLALLTRRRTFAVTPKQQESKLSATLLTHWTSVGIDWGWHHQWTYIIDADTADCASDKRGPGWL